METFFSYTVPTASIVAYFGLLVLGYHGVCALVRVFKRHGTPDRAALAANQAGFRSGFEAGFNAGRMAQLAEVTADLANVAGHLDALAQQECAR